MWVPYREKDNHILTTVSRRSVGRFLNQGLRIIEAAPHQHFHQTLTFPIFPSPMTNAKQAKRVFNRSMKGLLKFYHDNELSAFYTHVLARADPGRHRHCGRVECFFDDTQIEVTGKKFEGARLNYDNHVALSWQTFFVGPLLAGSHLGAPPEHKESPASDQPGNDVSAALPELLETNAHFWEKEEAYCYADSASSAGKYPEAIDGSFGAWSVSYNKWTSPLERGAGELPESQWSGLQEEKWRDGSIHHSQYAWLWHCPEGCENNQLFAVVRHRRAEGELFWRYAFVACQQQQGDPRAVFERHRLKGDRERLLSELLSDLDLHHPPCQSLEANRAYYALATLVYNAYVALRLIHLPEGEQPRRIRTLMRHLLLIPVEIKRHARRLKAALYAPAGWVEWWRGLLDGLLPRCALTGG